AASGWTGREPRAQNGIWGVVKPLRADATGWSAPRRRPCDRWPMTPWLGVDVGGKRKGLHIAVVDDRRVVTLAGGLDVAGVVGHVDAARPALVGIDSPRRCAPDGHAAREDERMLARSICAIRWTPDAAAVRSSAYFAWIIHFLVNDTATT